MSSPTLFRRVVLTALAVTVAAAAALVVMPTASAQSCEVRACRADDTYRDGYCHSEAGFPTFARSRTVATCRDGYSLNRASGMCTRSGVCCTENPLCGKGRRYTRSGSDGSGIYGVCQSDGPYPSHTLERCAAGWTLDTVRGVCRGECRGAIAAPKPDLTFRSVSLRPGVLRVGMAYHLCFTVANIGSGPSGPFRVGAGGLGIPVAPYQDHAALIAGATREGCIRYPTTPPVGKYKLGLKVDSLDAVDELREYNNERMIDVVINP